MAINDKLVYRLSLAIAPRLYILLTHLLFSTCRIKEYGRQYLDAVNDSPKPYIAAFWHYSLFYFIRRSVGRPWVAMVSGSKDGEYISRVLNLLGSTTVRGSRKKGGLAALREMVAQVDAGRSAAIVADGSQGPARRVQSGVILLASRTGAPILPLAWSADRYGKFKSWDRTILPYPFAKIYVRYGEPFIVPPLLKANDIEAYREQLEEIMNEIYRDVWNRVAREEH